MDYKLDARSARVLAFVKAHAEMGWGAPGMEAICDHMGYRSVESARDAMTDLVVLGYLTREAIPAGKRWEYIYRVRP
jgi:hypothetical protein